MNKGTHRKLSITNNSRNGLLERCVKEHLTVRSGMGNPRRGWNRKNKNKLLVS
jgi:hypothetical protein